MYSIVCAGRKSKQWKDDEVLYSVWQLRDGKTNPNYGAAPRGEHFPSAAECEEWIKGHRYFKDEMLVTEDQFREEAANRRMIVADLFSGLRATSVDYVFSEVEYVPD